MVAFISDFPAPADQPAGTLAPIVDDAGVIWTPHEIEVAAKAAWATFVGRPWKATTETERDAVREVVRVILEAASRAWMEP